MTDGSNGGGDDPPSRRTDDPLGTNSEIGRKLKRYFDGLVSEDVPDRFAQLLSQLEGTELARTGKD